ncbi:hypothetical protein AVEN_65679-1, partial [Araneus ventricosus]
MPLTIQLPLEARDGATPSPCAPIKLRIHEISVPRHFEAVPPKPVVSAKIRWDLARQIQETVDYVHMKTFTHAGPYYVGIVLGYLIIKYKDVKIPW